MIILIVLILLVVFVIHSHNALVKTRNKAKTNWAQIDVVLKRRADLIPNLVETVKGYAKHEESTLEGVMAARSRYLGATTTEEQMANAGEFTQALSRLLAVSENYPELKANEGFIALQNTLKETEDKIQYARQFYNDSVYGYSNKIESFPGNIIASLFGFKPMALFEVAEADKETPKVKF